MMQRVAKQILLSVTLVLLLPGGCTPRATWRSENRPGLQYRQELERLTRAGHLFSNVDRQITAYATWLRPGLLELLAGEYQRVFGIPLASGRDELALNLVRNSGQEMFFVSADFADTTDLGLEDPNGEWVVTLVAGNRVVTGRVYYLGRVARSSLRLFFPYVGDFNRSYLIGFPAQELGGAGQLVLRLAGAPGKLELSWPG